MPIVGEQSFSWQVDSGGDALNADAYEFNLPPSKVYAKIFLTASFEYIIPNHTSHQAWVRIFHIKRWRPGGSEELINIDSNGAYDDNMTSILYVLGAVRTIMEGIVVLEYWD